MRLSHWKAAAAAVLTLAFVTPAAAARIPIFWGTAERIIKVADFPDTNQFRTRDGSYIDAGYKYKVFEVFWVPLWDYDHTWAGYIGRDDAFVALSHEQLKAMAKGAGTELPAQPALPFWDAYGGKLVVGGLVVLLALFGLMGRSKAAA